jgi:inosine-uridine nucleoside N-ribohydrolase
MRKKVIIDCDNTMGKPHAEIDDGLTLLYLLGRDDIELLGITNCYANASIADVEYWTKRFLVDIERTDIPRFSGKPFSDQNTTEWFKRTWGHHFLSEKKPSPGSTDAARFLVEQAHRFPGEIHILALGSMTNLLEAWELDPDFFGKLAGISLMGGVYGHLELRGYPCRELNLACNPAGAHLVLNNGKCPVVVMNANICLQAPFHLADMESVSFWPERRKEMMREWIEVFQGAFYLWDLLPAVYLSHPELFDAKKVRISSSMVDLEQGILVEGGAGAELIMPDTILDTGRFMDLILAAWRVAWERESGGWKRDIV